MAYMLPLRFINVSTKPKVAICATRVVTMMSTDLYQARRTIRDERRAGTLINACGTGAAKTCIFLDNGAVVASPLSIAVLLNAIEKSNQKAQAKTPARLRIYDVYDPEPDPETEDDYEEMNTYDMNDDQDADNDDEETENSEQEYS